MGQFQMKIVPTWGDLKVEYRRALIGELISEALAVAIIILIGDGAAAMRYTEAKMTKFAEEMLIDIDKDTVDFMPNYDGSQKEPKVLPAKVPNLLLNGVQGIAVGMATNIPTHNLTEVVDAVIYLIDNPEAGITDLTKIVKGPDFPTGGVIFDDGGSANGSAGLTFNKSANTLTANTINAFSMRVTGNLYIGSNTVTISNNSISAQAIYVHDNTGSPILVASASGGNPAFDVANSAYNYANSVGTSGNAYALATATSIGVAGNNYTANAGFSANASASISCSGGW